MDKKNKSTKASENTRKTTRSGTLKSSVGIVAADNSPTPVGNSSSSNIRIQETKKRKLPDPVPLRIQYSIKKILKPAAAWRLKPINLRLVNLKLVSPKLSKPEAIQGERESSSKKNSGAGVMDFACLNEEVNGGI